MKKITFIGDITTDRPLLNAARLKNGSYDFSPVFSATKDLFKKSDLVIGNLETVCGGKKRNGFLLCNSPDELISELCRGGVTCVTTANNHCLDQGIEGVFRTIDLLDDNGVLHTGTRKKRSDENVLYVKVGNCCIAIISATYSINENNTGIVLDKSNDYIVNILRKSEININGNKYKAFVKSSLLKLFGAKRIRVLKRAVFRVALKSGRSYMQSYTDKIVSGDFENPYLDRVLNALQEARNKADLCFVVPHIGGQFNVKPGEYCTFLNELLINNGADSVISHHPHTLQKIECCLNGKLIAYSIGSFNQSISADYMIHEVMPEYSIALHFYIDDKKNNSKIELATFSILKIVEDKDKMITVYPVDKLAAKMTDLELKQLEKEVETIYFRILEDRRKFPGIREEYEVK